MNDNYVTGEKKTVHPKAGQHRMTVLPSETARITAAPDDRVKRSIK